MACPIAASVNSAPYLARAGRLNCRSPSYLLAKPSVVHVLCKWVSNVRRARRLLPRHLRADRALLEAAAALIA